MPLSRVIERRRLPCKLALREARGALGPLAELGGHTSRLQLGSLHCQLAWHELVAPDGGGQQAGSRSSSGSLQAPSAAS
jgi:hypothetical protein